MEKIKSGMNDLMAKDPAKLRDKGEKYQKAVMGVIIIGIILIVLAIIIWIFLALVSDRNAKLRHYKSNIAKWNKEGFFNFENARFVTKIMPSENTAKNIEVMTMYNVSAIENKKINSKYNYSQAYFVFNDTDNYFTTLRFDADEVPIGNSETFCIHLQWADAENEGIWDLYESVAGFPVCKNSQNPKFYWPSQDPTTGIDIQLWKQNGKQLDCTTKEDCEKQCKKLGGIYKKNKKTGNHCYWYDIIQGVCIKVEQDDLGRWKYAGGCYKNDEPLFLKKAVAGEVYKFNNLTIQVRSKYDPYTVATKETDGDLDFGIDLDIIYNFAFLLFFIGLILGVIGGMGILFKDFFSTLSCFQDDTTIRGKPKPFQPDTTIGYPKPNPGYNKFDYE